MVRSYIFKVNIIIHCPVFSVDLLTSSLLAYSSWTNRQLN